jgi:hypothetical protein
MDVNVDEKRQLSSYNDTVLKDCTIKNDEKENNILHLSQMLGLKPYTIFDEGKPEVSSMSTEENIDLLIKEYYGKKIFVSKKRREIGTDWNQENKHGAKRNKAIIPIAEDQRFSSRILKGPFAEALYQRSYLELSDDISLKLNQCWVQSPNLKYFAAKIFAGAILYNVDTSEALNNKY